jgi:hypothetical protein
MSNYRRCYVPGGSYFFTVVTERRAKILGNDLARDLLRAAFQDCFQRWPPFRVDAMVMLHDHMHATWTLPLDDAAYPKRWARLKNISLNPGSLWAVRKSPARHPALLIGVGVFGNAITRNILCAMKEITNGILSTFITIR